MVKVSNFCFVLIARSNHVFWRMALKNRKICYGLFFLKSIVKMRANIKTTDFFNFNTKKTAAVIKSIYVTVYSFLMTKQ